MFNLKHTIHSIAIITTSSAITLTSSAVNAATFSEFQLSGGVLVPGGISNVTLSGEALSIPELDFNLEPTPIGIINPTGIFTGFDTASIEDIIAFGPPIVVNNPFLDFGNSDVMGAGGVSTPANPSISDGIDTFELNEASYSLTQSGNNVAIDVLLDGDFVIGGQIYGGTGNLTFQISDTTVLEVETLLTNGGSLPNATFSGGLFTTESVPEPSTIIGLGLLGAFGIGTGVKRKKK
ncbi:PEP-CTERM sorting domain-containing protein [Crocosphaera sp.]|uniref:PEP-CTERM sorting domain-containing protein n=1 Tax=Crocosphaera sp. TaxID=2729996 RepID=UPI003F21111B|nr:PEP-CTERM sorting domain-containing protein [Crocosphaera sp.]